MNKYPQSSCTGMATTNPVVDELLTISISTIDVGKEERLMRVGCHYVPAHVKAAASLSPVRRRSGCYSCSSPLFSASSLHSLVTSSTSPFERENALFVSENCAAGLSSPNLKGLIDGALEE